MALAPGEDGGRPTPRGLALVDQPRRPPDGRRARQGPPGRRHRASRSDAWPSPSASMRTSVPCSAASRRASRSRGPGAPRRRPEAQGIGMAGLSRCRSATLGGPGSAPLPAPPAGRRGLARRAGARGRQRGGDGAWTAWRPPGPRPRWGRCRSGPRIGGMQPPSSLADSSPSRSSPADPGPSKGEPQPSVSARPTSCSSWPTTSATARWAPSAQVIRPHRLDRRGWHAPHAALLGQPGLHLQPLRPLGPTPDCEVRNNWENGGWGEGGRGPWPWPPARRPQRALKDAGYATGAVGGARRARDHAGAGEPGLDFFCGYCASASPTTTTPRTSGATESGCHRRQPGTTPPTAAEPLETEEECYARYDAGVYAHDVMRRGPHLPARARTSPSSSTTPRRSPTLAAEFAARVWSRSA